jgi:flagellar biosynthetic protein FlhB
MADEDGDKTEAPTPRRRAEAREQGNIARSMDLTAAALMIGSMVLLRNYGTNVIAALKTFLEQMLSPHSFNNVDPYSIPGDFMRAMGMVTMALAPLLLGLMVIAVLSNVFQVGLMISTKRLTPNIAGLNPFKGVGKLLGGGKGPMQLAMSLAKLFLVGFFAYTAISTRMPLIVRAQELGYMQIFALGGEVIYAIALRIGIVLFILALFDYAYQKYTIEKSLKMTKQEVKEEMRRMEGDPHIKQRRRQIAMQIAHKKLQKDVPTADVIVTNPTHFAIALKYDQGTMHAPRVVAKGADLMAQRIREIAAAHGIPILERKPLARALYKMCDVGDEIPEEFYSTVAEILAYVYELTGKMRNQRRLQPA